MYVFWRLLQKKGCHSTWSSKPCKGLAICRAKEVHSSIFVSYIFKALSISETPGIEPTTYSFVVKCYMDWAAVSDLINAQDVYLILGGPIWGIKAFKRGKRSFS